MGHPQILLGKIFDKWANLVSGATKVAYKPVFHADRCTFADRAIRWAFGVDSMRRFHSICVALLAGIAQTIVPRIPLHAQVVHICCTTEDCKNRQVKPNLRLVKSTHLFGVLADPSGAPFKRSKVELRRWISTTDQVSLKVVETDDSGRFDVGVIEAGQYRFLPSATGGFKQPESLSCPQAECRVELVLQINPTDTPESVCPIR
jgi:hypothetical protein